MGLATSDGTAAGTYLNDCNGTKTNAADTIITFVVPPSSGLRSCVGNFLYDCGTTAHTLTMMVAIDEVAVSSEAASGQAVVNISRVPTSSDGSVIANTDFFVLQYEDGSWAVHKVSSASGLAITMTANLAQKILKGSRAFFMGQPSDHSSRQFTMRASKTTTFPAGDFRIRAATSTLNNQPILVHSDNATAQGWLIYLSYYYDSAA